MTAEQTLQKMGLSDNPIAPEKTGKQFNGTIYYAEIRSKTGKRHGLEYGGNVLKGHKAIIMPNEYINIYGQEWNHIHAPVDFNKTFNIGDSAEYHSYNLKYVGKITAIKEKYIEIETMYKEKTRLSIYEFSWRNWDFDAIKTAEYNAEESMYL